MPFDTNFAEAFIQAMLHQGWYTSSLTQHPNPMDIEFVRDSERLRLIVHARRLTAQQSPESDHNRPQGELHMQLIFDGDRRGAGNRNRLRFVQGASTLLLGFYPYAQSYVIAAYDPKIHVEYAYSKSLQLKIEVVESAWKEGLVIYKRKNDEIVVVFPLSEIPNYLEMLYPIHHLSHMLAAETDEEEFSYTVSVVKDIMSALPPALTSETRKYVFALTGRYYRRKNFEQGIKAVYKGCAICGFDYDDNLDAAHIVPVAEGGTDTYDNGLGLCPNCHRMFDKGQILVDDLYNIHINQTYASAEDAAGLLCLQQRLKPMLWLPEDPQYHPAPENLRKTFEKRRL